MRLARRRAGAHQVAGLEALAQQQGQIFGLTIAEARQVVAEEIQLLLDCLMAELPTDGTA